ncbi:MAG: alpha-amylase family glycosyl hydrolase [Cyclobacteriaceae bacterium]
MNIFQNTFLRTLPILWLLWSCNAPKASDEGKDFAEFPHAVTYEIFVQSFADSNGDGIGDIAGMTSRLDYLQELGVRGIWLMPIMPSPSYHKYDVIDYKAIHPDYGTMDDFKHFLAEAKKRDIKVVIDMIINHTSNRHPWFLKSSSSKDNPYRDYYVWADEATILRESKLVKEATGDSDNKHQWHDMDGQDEKYYGFFYGGMPDLNFDNEKVKEEIFDIGRFWLEEVGVDGFRLDAAKHIFEDNRVADNHAFWVEYREAMEAIKPDVYIIGEVWAPTEQIAPFLSGLPSLFNFDLAYSILESLNKEQNLSATVKGHGTEINEGITLEDAFLIKEKIYAEITTDYVDAIFLSNHDQNRVMSVLGNDIAKAKQAAAILLSLPGTPYLYYGEEIGMRGMKPDPTIREPFLWDSIDKDTARATWIEPKFTMDESLVPLAMQKQDPNKIFHTYKKLIAIRNHSEALTFGQLEKSPLSSESLMAWYRTYEGKQVLVLHNLSSSQSADISISELNKAEILFASHDNMIVEGAVNMPPNSSIFILTEKL